MRQNNSRNASRGRDNRRSNAPKFNSVNRAKQRRSKMTTNQRRASVGSVFAAPSSKSQHKENEEQNDERGNRLQQVLAAAGYGSRRSCEELILDGRVEVDGKIVTELGVRVKPFEQKIRVDGEALKQSRPTYIAFNKPKNALCTNNDPSGRRLAIDFIPASFGRLFAVGRLDQNSEGLLLLTNDGALAQRLAHPKYETPKKYRVQVAGLVDYHLVEALKNGIHIAEGVVQADEVIIKSRHKLSSVLEITLTEGKNREIRRMLASVKHKVMQLQRVQIGSIKLGDLAPGEFRLLGADEVAELYRLAEEKPEYRRQRRPNAVPIEVAELQDREEDKESERQEVKKRSDPFYSKAVKTQFKRSRFDEREEGSRRREPREEFREEFRDEERASERRRVRRQYDDESRTIGVKKFDRSERPERERFDERASERRTNVQSFRERFGRDDRQHSENKDRRSYGHSSHFGSSRVENRGGRSGKFGAKRSGR